MYNSRPLIMKQQPLRDISFSVSKNASYGMIPKFLLGFIVSLLLIPVARILKKDIEFLVWENGKFKSIINLIKKKI